MSHHKTGKKNDYEWDSKLWHESGDLDCQWAESDNFRLIETQEVTP